MICKLSIQPTCLLLHHSKNKDENVITANCWNVDIVYSAVFNKHQAFNFSNKAKVNGTHACHALVRSHLVVTFGQMTDPLVLNY